MGSRKGKKTHSSTFKRAWGLFDNFLRYLNDIIYSINFSRSYRLCRKDILHEYLELKIETIEEFAAVYTYDFAFEHGLMNNREIKEAIYNDVLEILYSLKARGQLVRSDSQG